VTREKGHGRIETRATHVYPLEDPASIGFPHARTLLKTVRSSRETRTGKTSSETAYHLASEDHGARTPAAWAALVRGHWGIENRNHWRRDACALEDKTRSKDPSVVASFAISRCALLYFNAQTESRNINAFMEANQAKHAAVLSMVTRSG
jgi:predicted transposase YbfD/YdcC